MRNQEDEYQRIHLVWGLAAADISKCDQKSADFCFGQPQYDDKFDMNTAEAQIAFKVTDDLLQMFGKIGFSDESQPQSDFDIKTSGVCLLF